MFRSARLLAIVLAASVVVSVVLAPAASASGYTRDDAFFCSGNGVYITAPQVWTNNANTPETVFWVPVLFQYGSSGWAAVNNAGWAIATVTNQGQAVVPWTDYDEHYGAKSRSFTVPAGSYAIQNAVVWADGTIQRTWVPSAHNSLSYCTVGARAAQPGTSLGESEASSTAPAQFHLGSRIVAQILDALVQGSRADGVSPPSPS